MTASGRSFSIDAKAVSSSSLLLILTGLIVVPVASPPSFICSRKGLEKGSVALARAITRRAHGSISRISCTLSPAISGLGHDDRDFERRLLCRQSGGCEPRDDYIDFETDQLGGQFGKPVEVSFSRSKLKSNVLPLDIPQIAQPLPKLPPKLFWVDIANDQCADGRHLRLLRVGRERPHGRRGAEQPDELPPSHVEHGASSLGFLPRG